MRTTATGAVTVTMADAIAAAAGIVTIATAGGMLRIRLVYKRDNECFTSP